ncbi:MAG TPA: thiamine pyrophosphate-dependent enzyme, partial [Burkholderiaceae bacterium]|nr:thiamine pyrophosphate-dependent enzyme [Burkholderiaceae bacterium]
FPMWSYPADVRIEGDSARILAQLLEAMQAIAPAGFAQTAARRVEQLASAQRARAAQVSAAAAEAGEPGRLNPQHVCAQLGRLLSPRDVVLNEAIRNAPAVFAQIPRTEPGSLIGLAGGGLGFSGGMALGVKLARRDRTVVQVVGDGTFYFCNPEAVYAVSRQYDLPILTVVLDNSGWAAVKEATLRMYPDGHARRRSEYESLLAPKMDFAKIAESAGAYGEVLEDPAQTGAALERCLDAVRSGRSAVLHARVAPL